MSKQSLFVSCSRDREAAVFATPVSIARRCCSWGAAALVVCWVGALHPGLAVVAGEADREYVASVETGSCETSDSDWSSLLEIEDAGITRLRADTELAEWRVRGERTLYADGHAAWREVAAAELTVGMSAARMRSASRYRSWLDVVCRQATERSEHGGDRTWELHWVAASTSASHVDPVAMSHDERQRCLTNLLRIAETRGSATACDAAEIQCEQQRRQVVRFESMLAGTGNASETERARLELAVARAALSQAKATRSHFQNTANRLRILLAELPSTEPGEQVRALADADRIRMSKVRDHSSELVSPAAEFHSEISGSTGRTVNERRAVEVASQYRRLRLDAIAELYSAGHASRFEWESAQWDSELSDQAVDRQSRPTASASSVPSQAEADTRLDMTMREFTERFTTELAAPLDAVLWTDGGVVRRAVAARREQWMQLADMDCLRLEGDFQNEVVRRLKVAGAQREGELHQLSVEFLSARQAALSDQLVMSRTPGNREAVEPRSPSSDEPHGSRLIKLAEVRLAEIPLRQWNEEARLAVRRCEQLHKLKALGHASVTEVERAELDAALARLRVRAGREQQTIARYELEILRLTTGG